MSSFSPIPLTPSMDTNTLINAINNNFRQVESENRTKVIRDEEGTPRVIIGRFPNGEYGVIVSKKGKNVLEYKDFQPGAGT